uniref:Cysteine-rich receptor-like protein kinase 42 n=1 Tax=Rhizophora mucronata TaxID=61149 RepID=A0A2P2LIH2_RHIMU
MESKIWNLQLCAIAVTLTWCGYLLKIVSSDPGINPLSEGCSKYNVTSSSNFNNNLSQAFRELRTKLRTNKGKNFATAQQLSGADPVYAMAQCRRYMSTADCIACFTAASAQVRNCSAASGGRVVYDGCFVRYFYNIQLFFLICSLSLVSKEKQLR